MSGADGMDRPSSGSSGSPGGAHEGERLVGDSGATYRLDASPPASGGEALVYCALAEDDGARVAVRVELVPGTLARQTAHWERLAADPLAGPVVVPVWDHGTWDDRHFQVLDWLPVSLSRWSAGRPLSTRREAARALVAAVRRLHATGTAHGDLKPDNVVLRDEDPASLLLADIRPPGAIGFTSRYAPPEQRRGQPGSLAADRFALAATVWALSTGAPPEGVAGAGGPAVTSADRARWDDLVGDVALRRCLERCLVDAPADRPPLEDLERALVHPDDPPHRPPPASRPARRTLDATPARAASVLAAVLLLGLVAAWLHHRAPVCPAGFTPTEAAGGALVCAHPDGRSVARVEPGRFVMGRAPSDDPERLPDADPHEVVLTRPFWLGTTEVTQAQWTALAGSNPAAEREQVFDGGVVAPCDTWHGHDLVGDDLPVVCVSFLDVVGWLADLSRRDGLRPAYVVEEGEDGPAVRWDRRADGWRLPTEAEWEWAAIAGGEPDDVCARANLRDQSAPEHWGNEAPCDDGDPVLAAVGRRPANRLGLHDLEGNVLEWVWDRYGPYPAGPVVDPTGPRSGPARVARGASWNHVPRGVRARYAASPQGHGYSLGFRIARDGR